MVRFAPNYTLRSTRNTSIRKHSTHCASPRSPSPAASPNSSATCRAIPTTRVSAVSVSPKNETTCNFQPATFNFQPRSMETEQAIQAFRQSYTDLRAQIGKVIVGHDPIVEGTLIALFAGGHVLLE